MSNGILMRTGQKQNHIRPSPPPPIFSQKAFLRGGEGGVHFEPPRVGILYPPPLLYAPTPRRVFSGAKIGENARFKSGRASVETRVLKTLACRKNVGGFFKHW